VVEGADRVEGWMGGYRMVWNRGVVSVERGVGWIETGWVLSGLRQCGRGDRECGGVGVVSV
jgi:hypothetical protein